MWSKRLQNLLKKCHYAYSQHGHLDGRVGYTRNGTFSTNSEGVLTTSSGYVVQPEIALPDGVSQINISRDGIISVLVAGGVGAEAVGQFQIADFTNRDL